MSNIQSTPNMVARIQRQYARHVTNVKQGTSDLKIILIDGKLADVFTGNGWANRSRYRLMQGRWCYVSGLRLSVAQQAALPLKVAA